MKCKYCGAEVANDAQFCPNCGKDLSKLRKCVKCGEIIDDDATFCPHCGAENPIYDEGGRSHKWVWIVVTIVAIIAAFGAFYYFSHGKTTPGVITGPDSTSSTERKSEKVSDDASIHTPKFGDLLKLYVNGIGEVGINPSELNKTLSAIGLDKVYYNERTNKSEFDGQPDEKKLDVVYGKNVMFSVSTDSEGNITSTKLTPKGKKFFAIVLTNILLPPESQSLFDDMYVYSDDKNLIDNYFETAQNAGFSQDETDKSRLFFTSSVPAWLSKNSKEGMYYLRFERDH